MRVVQKHRSGEDPHELFDGRVVGNEDPAVEPGVASNSKVALQIAIRADPHRFSDVRAFSDRHTMAA